MKDYFIKIGLRLLLLILMILLFIWIDYLVGFKYSVLYALALIFVSVIDMHSEIRKNER